MRQSLLVITVLVGSVGLLAAPRQGERPLPTISEVRKTLNDRQGDPQRTLVPFGEPLYPTLETILTDSTDYEAMQIFLVLQQMRGDRSRFVPHVVRRLADPVARIPAIGLLSQIGSRRDTAPLVALLWDADVQSVRMALMALEKLGGEREQAAIDIWITAKTDDLRAAEQVRDAIRKRVEEEKKRTN